MTQVGKLYKKIPYLVRDKDNSYKSVSYAENILNELINKYQFQLNDIVNVFSNNRDNILHFHIVIRIHIPKDNINIKYKDEDVEFTFEEYKESKTKTKYINSFMFIETFKHLNEKALVEVFDEMIGCNGKNLFISIQKEKLKIFLPSSKHYLYRNILLEKEFIVKDIANSFGISTEKLYKDLNPNIIKQVCKDLDITYKTLALELGYKPDTINKAASTEKISEQLFKAIDLYLENLKLKEDLKKFNSIKETLQNAII